MKEQGIFSSPNEGSFKSVDEIRQRNAFPDKKKQIISFETVTDIIDRERRMEEEFDIGQREATWKVPISPDKPIVVCLITDPHFGSVRANVNLFREHLDIIQNTPRMFCVFNGDDVDNFNATGKWAAGMFENPTPPEIVSRAIAKRYKELDDMGKIGTIGFGNHNDFGFAGGQDWYDSFLGGFNCPIFTSGGELHVTVGSQTYDLAMAHKYWGTSKLNPTNACKRFMDFEYPDADIAFLGHCFSSDTEVLTALRGWKTFDKVKVGELVMTRNLKNGNSEWNQVKEKFKYSSFKKMVHFKNRDVDLLVTPEHAVIATIDYQNYPYKRVEAKELIGLKRYMPTGGINKQKDIRVSDDWLRLVAWIITEGNYSSGSLGHIRISQSEKKKVSIKHITDICDRLGLSYSCIKRYSKGLIEHGQHRNYDAYRINLHSCEITKKIRIMFPKKQLTSWFFELSNRQFEILFKELILADGCKNSMGYGYQYASKWVNEIDTLQALCAINGYRTSKLKRSRRGAIYYILTINPRGRIMIIKGGKYVKYEGMVYCVSVKNETLLVRRNGKVVVSGNTHQSEGLHFEKGGKDRIAVIGGTYKDRDNFARKHGIGGRSGSPGWAVALWPNERKMQLFKDLVVAREFITDGKTNL